MWLPASNNLTQSFFADSFDMWRHFEPYLMSGADLGKLSTELTAQVDIVEQGLAKTILHHREDFMEHLSRLGAVHAELYGVDALITRVRARLGPLLDPNEPSIRTVAAVIAEEEGSLTSSTELLNMLTAVRDASDALDSISPDRDMKERVAALITAKDRLATLPRDVEVGAVLDRKVTMLSRVLVRSHGGVLLNTIAALDSDDCGSAIAELEATLADADAIGALADRLGAGGVCLTADMIAGRFISEMQSAASDLLHPIDPIADVTMLPVHLTQCGASLDAIIGRVSGLVVHVISRYSAHPPPPAMVDLGRALLDAAPAVIHGLDAVIETIITTHEDTLAASIEALVVLLEPVQHLIRTLLAGWHGIELEVGADDVKRFGDVALGTQPMKAEAAVLKAVTGLAVTQHQAFAAQLDGLTRATDFTAMRVYDLPERRDLTPAALDLDALPQLLTITPPAAKQAVVAAVASLNLLGMKVDVLHSKHRTVEFEGEQFGLSPVELLVGIALVNYLMIARAFEPVAPLASDCAKSILSAYSTELRAALLQAKAVERKQLARITSNNLALAASSTSFILHVAASFTVAMSSVAVPPSSVQEIGRIQGDLYRLRGDLLKKITDVLTACVTDHIPRWYSAVAVGSSSGTRTGADIADKMLRSLSAVAVITRRAVPEDAAREVLGPALDALVETFRARATMIDALIATTPKAYAKPFTHQAKKIVGEVGNGFGEWHGGVKALVGDMAGDEVQWAKRVGR